jgi:hypothetical protein
MFKRAMAFPFLYWLAVRTTAVVAPIEVLPNLDLLHHCERDAKL